MTYFHEEQRFGWWISAIVLIALVVTCAMVLIALATTAQRAPAFALVVLPLIFFFVMTKRGLASGSSIMRSSISPRTTFRPAA